MKTITKKRIIDENTYGSKRYGLYVNETAIIKILLEQNNIDYIQDYQEIIPMEENSYYKHLGYNIYENVVVGGIYANKRFNSNGKMVEQLREVRLDDLFYNNVYNVKCRNVNGFFEVEII